MVCPRRGNDIPINLKPIQIRNEQRMQLRYSRIPPLPKEVGLSKSLWITVYTKEGKVLNVFKRTGSGLNDIDNYYQINRLFNTLTHYIQTPDEERGLEKRYWLQVHVPQTTSRISARYLVQQKHFPDIWETLTLDEIIHSKNIYNTWFTTSALEHVDETGTIRKTNVII